MSASARATKRRAARTARRGARSRLTKGAGRLGFAAKGVLYLIVALIALGVAVGERRRPEDQSGALATLAGEPAGRVLMIALALGLAGYALWRLAFAVVGTPGSDDASESAERLGSLVLAAVYASLCAYAIGIIAGAGVRNGASTGPDEATRTLLDQPLGVALVIAVGLVLAGLAGFEAYKAISRSFLDDLATSRMSERERAVAVLAGTAGHAARAVVSALVAAFVIKAAVEHRASEAIGLDGALSKLAAQSAGPLLLGIVAAGLAVYGLYCLVEARYRKLG